MIAGNLSKFELIQTTLILIFSKERPFEKNQKPIGRFFGCFQFENMKIKVVLLSSNFGRFQEKLPT